MSGDVSEYKHSRYYLEDYTLRRDMRRDMLQKLLECVDDDYMIGVAGWLDVMYHSGLFDMSEIDQLVDTYIPDSQAEV